MDVTRADSACAPGAGSIRIHPRLPLKGPNSMTAGTLALRLMTLTDPDVPALA